MIPMRCIHRGMVIHCLHGRTQLYGDLLKAMAVANIYRNCWLLVMDMGYYNYMVSRLGKRNAYIEKYETIVVFNAPYSTDKYVDIDLDGSSGLKARSADFEPTVSSILGEYVPEEVLPPPGPQYPPPNMYPNQYYYPPPPPYYPPPDNYTYPHPGHYPGQYYNHPPRHPERPPYSGPVPTTMTTTSSKTSQGHSVSSQKKSDDSDGEVLEDQFTSVPNVETWS